MTEFQYFILGLLVSIPVSILSPLATSRLQKYRAERDTKQSEIRQELLTRDYNEIKRYKENPIELVQYLAIRLLLINLIWVGQGALDYVFGLVANSSYSYYFLSGNQTIPVDEVGNTTNAIGSLVGVAILFYTFRLAFRTYRLVRKVMNFDTYQAEVQSELAVLRERDNERRTQSRPSIEGVET
jgi:hypothetical protein